MNAEMKDYKNDEQIEGLDADTESVEWITVKIPGTGQHQTVQDNSWILTNLSSASSYECLVQVQPVSAPLMTQSIAGTEYLWLECTQSYLCLSHCPPARDRSYHTFTHSLSFSSFQGKVSNKTGATHN